MNRNNKTTIKIVKGIHVGAKTHHQDQLIMPINFNTINAIVSRPRKPTPLDELELELYCFIFFIYYPPNHQLPSWPFYLLFFQYFSVLHLIKYNPYQLQ